MADYWEDTKKNATVDDIAKVIDPVTFSQFDEAFGRHDWYDMMKYVHPMNVAREKARVIIEIVKTVIYGGPTH